MVTKPNERPDVLKLAEAPTFVEYLRSRPLYLALLELDQPVL